MYRKKQYIYGLVLSAVSDFHWGSWNASPANTGRLQYIQMYRARKLILLNPFMYLRSVYLFEDYWIIMSSAACQGQAKNELKNSCILGK